MNEYELYLKKTTFDFDNYYYFSYKPSTGRMMILNKPNKQCVNYLFRTYDKTDIHYIKVPKEVLHHFTQVYSIRNIDGTTWDKIEPSRNKRRAIQKEFEKGLY